MGWKALLEAAHAAIRADEPARALAAIAEARAEAPASARVALEVLEARARLGTGALPAAREAALRAVEASRGEDPPVVAIAEVALGAVLLEEGRLDRARPLLERGAEALGGRGADGAYALQQLARLELTARRYAVAIEVARRLERSAARAGLPALAQKARLLQAHAEGQVGRIDAAVRACEALLAEPHAAPRHRADVLRELAWLHQSAGRRDEATRRIEEALAVLPPGDAPVIAGGLWTQLGSLRLAADDPVGATEAYRRAEALLAPLGSVRVRATRLNLVIAALRRRDPAEARARLDALLASPTAEADRPILVTLLLPCFAQQGDRAGWDRAAGTARRLLERGTIVSGSLCDALRDAAATWEASGDPGDLARAMRARELALGQAGPHQAREVEALRALRARGAPIPAGGWDLGERLGIGGMGEVRAARHHARGTEAAVKLLLAGGRSLATLRALFDAEMRAVARLDHPNVVRVLDHGALGAAAEILSDGALAAGTPWLAMERARGGSLDRRIGRLDWPAVRHVLRSLLDALAHAHAQGLLHLDLKPANVLLDPTGDRPDRVLLSDFGLAGLRALAPGASAGTADYMPPEQFDGDPAALGPWTDLYALGCVAVELCAGAPPFRAAAREALAEAHRTAEPVFVPAFPVPPGFVGWVRRLLAKAPRDRFVHAAEARRALDALEWPVAGGFPALPPPPPIRPSASPALLPHRALPPVGRAEERARAWAALAEVAARGGPRALVVEGPPGSGRAALLAWLAERARALGAAEVVHPATPEQARLRATGPTLALADDDPALAEALARAEGPVLVAATVEVPGLPTTRIALGPMPDAEVRALLAALLPLDPALADALARRAAGLPGLAFALLLDLADRDALEPGPDGFALAPGIEPGLAERVLDVWEARLRRALPDAALDALVAAALTGPRVSAPTWGALAARQGLDPAAILRRAADAGLATALPDGGLAIPDLAREALVQLARADRRLAECSRLALVVVDPAALDPERAGLLLREAGDPARAAPRLVEAAARRAARGDRAAAERLRGMAADALLALGIDPDGDDPLARALARVPR